VRTRRYVLPDDTLLPLDLILPDTPVPVALQPDETWIASVCATRDDGTGNTVRRDRAYNPTTGELMNLPCPEGEFLVTECACQSR
jgi:hypothetical protein